MAYVSICFCEKCHKTWQGIKSNNRNICIDCLEEERREQKILYFEGLNGLTVEERLRKIEEWIFKQNQIDHSKSLRDIKFY